MGIKSCLRGFFLVGEIRAILLKTAYIVNMNQRDIMSALETLTSEVSETKTVVQSAVVLLVGLKTKLDEAIAANENGDNGAALELLSTELDTANNALAAAVVANTPAVVTPDPTPETSQPDPVVDPAP